MKYKIRKEFRIGMNVRKDILINNILITKNEILINELTRIYGMNTLLDVGELGLDIFSRKVIDGNFSLVEGLYRVEEVRKVLNYISKIYERGDENIKYEIIDLVKNIRKTPVDSSFTYSAKLSFLESLITIDCQVLERADDVITSTLDELLDTISMNKNLKMEDLTFICENLIEKKKIYPVKELFKTMISNLIEYVNLDDCSLSTIVHLIGNIKTKMIMLEERYKENLSINSVLYEGIKNLIDDVKFVDNLFRLMKSILQSSDIMISYNKDLFIYFFKILSEELLLPTKIGIDDFIYNEKENDGYIPFDYVCNKIEDDSIEGLIYCIYYNVELNDFPMILFYNEVKKRIDIVELLINKLQTLEIIDETFVSDLNQFVKRHKEEESSKYIEEGIEEDKPFDLESILDELESFEI